MLRHTWLSLGPISHLDQPLHRLGLQPTHNSRIVDQNQDFNTELKYMCVLAGGGGDEAAGRNCLSGEK